MFLGCDCFTWKKWSFLVCKVSQTWPQLQCSNAMVITSERDSLQRLSVFEEGNTSRVSQTQVVQAKSQSRESNVNLASQKPVALITRESEIQRAQSTAIRASQAHIIPFKSRIRDCQTRNTPFQRQSRVSNANRVSQKPFARVKRN